MTLKILTLCVSLAAAMSNAVAFAGQGSQTSGNRAIVAGVIRDSTGAAVAGAVVIVRTDGRAEQQTVTGPDGQFSLDVPAGDLVLIVRFGGFAEYQQHLPATSGSLSIALKPATLLETVVVTATRTEQRLGDVPASVNVMTRDEIAASPAVVADDVLRQVPTFSLFRRTSSLAAQPTTQGVSLRGIGPSGQSRTLVLLDGVPFKDPFGGWCTGLGFRSSEWIASR